MTDQAIPDKTARMLNDSKQKPAVPGEVNEYVYMPPRGFMKGRLLSRGQVIRIIDLEGKQCFDLIMWDAANMYNVLSCGNTVMLNNRSLLWRPGDAIYSKNADVLAVFGEDTTGGIHPAGGSFCNEGYWRAKFGLSGCLNCRDNFVAAMADFNFSANDLDWDSCITFMEPFTYDTNGGMTRYESKRTPGDYVDIRAERDIIVAISNCPAERAPVNAYNPTGLMTVIFTPDIDYINKLEEAKEQYKT